MESPGRKRRIEQAGSVTPEKRAKVIGPVEVLSSCVLWVSRNKLVVLCSVKRRLPCENCDGIELWARVSSSLSLTKGTLRFISVEKEFSKVDKICNLQIEVEFSRPQDFAITVLVSIRDSKMHTVNRKEKTTCLVVVPPIFYGPAKLGLVATITRSQIESYQQENDWAVSPLNLSDLISLEIIEDPEIDTNDSECKSWKACVLAKPRIKRISGLVNLEMDILSHEEERFIFSQSSQSVFPLCIGKAQIIRFNLRSVEMRRNGPEKGFQLSLTSKDASISIKGGPATCPFSESPVQVLSNMVKHSSIPLEKIPFPVGVASVAPVSKFHEPCSSDFETSSTIPVLRTNVLSLMDALKVGPKDVAAELHFADASKIQSWLQTQRESDIEGEETDETENFNIERLMRFWVLSKSKRIVDASKMLKDHPAGLDELRKQVLVIRSMLGLPWPDIVLQARLDDPFALGDWINHFNPLSVVQVRLSMQLSSWMISQFESGTLVEVVDNSQLAHTSGNRDTKHFTFLQLLQKQHQVVKAWFDDLVASSAHLIHDAARFYLLGETDVETDSVESSKCFKDTCSITPCYDGENGKHAHDRFGEVTTLLEKCTASGERRTISIPASDEISKPSCDEVHKLGNVCPQTKIKVHSQTDTPDLICCKKKTTSEYNQYFDEDWFKERERRSERRIRRRKRREMRLQREKMAMQESISDSAPIFPVLQDLKGYEQSRARLHEMIRTNRRLNSHPIANDYLVEAAAVLAQYSSPLTRHHSK